MLVDTAEYPQHTSLSLGYGDPAAAPGAAAGRQLTARGESIDLDRVGAVWWRRPLPYLLDPSLDESAASWAFSECHEAISGMWASLDAAFVNPLAADEIARHKPLQLHRADRARAAGPADPDHQRPGRCAALRRASAGRDARVYKTFLATEENWRETRLVRARSSELLDAVRLAPVIFQEYVDAVADLRVTVLGEQVWPAEIVAAPGVVPRGLPDGHGPGELRGHHAARRRSPRGCCC